MADRHALTLVTLASGTPMGQQAYESAISSRAPAALGTDWTVRSSVVRSLRSPLPGTVRVPSRLLSKSSEIARRAAGGLVYARAGLVHRMDLRLPPAGAAEVLTIHDTVAWRFPDEGAPPPSASREANRAAVVICPSAFSANEVATLMGVPNAQVILNGVDHSFFDTVALGEEALAELGLQRPFLLHAGGCTRRKNLPALAAAWPVIRQARPDLTLAMLGPTDPRRTELFAALPGTRLLGRVASELVAPLMAAATAVVIPSLYEGFGLPAIEAMAAGVPVVASARSSLPEVCGDAAILTEPTAQGLTDGVLDALSGRADLTELIRRGRERARTFSWETSLQQHCQVWRSAA